MEISRREFIAASAAGLTLAGCDRFDPFGIVNPETNRATNGIEKWVATSCGMCPLACAMKARVVDGNAVKVERSGDVGLCPRAHASVPHLYDPDRLRTPMKRKGPRGSGEFVPVGWDEALAELAAALQGLRDRSRLAVVREESADLRYGVVDRFLHGFGARGSLSMDPYQMSAPRTAARLTLGQAVEPIVDWRHVHLVLSLGAPLYESGPRYASNLAGLAAFRRAREGRRGRLIHVEPRYSLTSAKADVWIPVVPGTEGLLALGISHVLLREGQYVRSRVVEHSTGFEAWAGRVEREFSPERVARETGVPADEIVKLADELWELRPSVVLPGPTLYTNSTMGALAAFSLNALLSAFEPESGLLMPRLPAWPPFDMPVSKGTLEGAEAILLLHADPLREAAPAEARRWKDRLGGASFVAAFGNHLDETASHADLVLPPHTPLEDWDLTPRDGVVVLRRPAVPPFRPTRALAEIFIDLGKRLGIAAPAETWEDVVRLAARKCFEQDHPTAPGGDFDGFWDRMARTSEGPVRTHVDRTAGKFDFPAGDLWAPPRFEGDGKEFPCVLYPFRNGMDAGVRGGNAAWLWESYGFYEGEQWSAWVEVDPATASALSLEMGRPAIVESPAGRVAVRVRISEGVPPGIVAVPAGIGGGRGRWGVQTGPSIAALLSDLRDGPTGSPAGASVRVRLIAGEKS